MRATSVAYVLERAASGGVVNPSWLFTTMCTVPPVRKPGSIDMPSVSATTPSPANAASPCMRIGRMRVRSSSPRRSCSARAIPSSTGSTASRCDGFDASSTSTSVPARMGYLPLMPTWYCASPDPWIEVGSTSPSNSRKMRSYGLPITFASTFSLPRCGMPNIAFSTPSAAPSSSSASTIGIRLSPPSRP